MCANLNDEFSMKSLAFWSLHLNSITVIIMEAHYLSLYLTVGSGECAKTLHAMYDTIWSEVKSTGSPMQMQKTDALLYVR